MEEGLDSNPKSSRGRSSLCGCSGSMKSKTKESQPRSPVAKAEASISESPSVESQDPGVNRPTLKQRWKNFRKSQRGSPNESGDGKTSSKMRKGKYPSTSRKGLNSVPGSVNSPTSTVSQTSGNSEDSHVSRNCPPTMTSPESAGSPSSSKSPTSSGKDGTKTKSGMELATTKQNLSSEKPSLAERTRSLFRFQKKKINSSAKQPGVHDEQGSSENAALIPDTSPTSSKSAKHGHQGSLLEIKLNIVSERRAVFANRDGEQLGKPSQEQPCTKTVGKKAVTYKDPGSSCEEHPSCSFQNVQPEQLSSPSTSLEPTDESGTKAEKKKHGKRSMPSLLQLFKSKRTKGNDKSKATNKERAGDNEATNNEDDVFVEASGKSSVAATSSSRLQKSQGKSFQSSHIREQNKSRDSMMKAIYKRVENLTVPELLKATIVKSSPGTHQEATPAKVDSPSQQHQVEIPSYDNNELFFSTPESNTDQSHKPSATDDDLDFLKREPILQSAKKAKPLKNQKPSGNPLRNLAERDDLVTSYAEKQPNVKPATNRSSGFTREALAGLASTEDFSRVALRKVESAPAIRNQPFKEQMLLLIKGRKYSHARLVEPCARSINAGDCYVLVMPNSVHVWLGDSCNVIEKSKATDVAKQIVDKRDLGYKGSSGPIVIGKETKHNLKLAKDFWSILGEKNVPKVQDKGPPEEDEIYEKSVIETNVVYEVSGTRLKPLDDYCGTLLRYEMLNTKTSAVLIFDFGGEMYVWMGKESKKEEKQYGMQLAEELWKQGYDYTSFSMNPLSPLRDKKNGGLPLKGHVRPAWALLGRVIQGIETALFKEKFFDWPDPNRLIKCRASSPQSESKDDPFVELKPCDVDKMIKSKREPVSFMWDGIRIGRCRTWIDEAHGLKKEKEIETEGIDVWHVAEFACNEVDEAYHGQFYDGDTYVVRWRYHVNDKGLSGKSQSSLPGRSRCAYFFWQGEGSSVTEKGACALMTVELDKEKGPQIRVEQNKEPPCFLALFKGQMIVHNGKKDEKSASSCKRSHLYMVRNELPDEAYLMEIQVQVDNLRSRSSFLLLNAESDRLTIWHGARSPEHTRQRAKELTNTLRKWLSLKFSCDWKISEMEVNEGSESAEFWKIIGSSDRSRYDSLLKSSVSLNCSLHRAFLLSGVTLSFEAIEISSPSLNENLCCPFPVFQSDLYGSSQPALFLIDSGDVVYLWQGYRLLESNATENRKTGYADFRFTAERRCAMETVLAYCKAVNPAKPPPAYIVYAGVEPVAFTNLFPSWCVDETARTSSLEDGKKLGEMKQVTEVLANMKKNQYTLAELQSLPLPDGVDPLKLESYLSDEEFKKVFDCDKDEFCLLPPWKQTDVKKSLGLF